MDGWVDPAEYYPRIDAPTLLLKADADGDELARNHRFADHLPNGRLVHVPDAGHCVFRGNRERATSELRTFLDAH